MSSLISLRLARLIAIVDDRLLFQKTLREVRQMRQWVLDAEHILSADFLSEGSAVTNNEMERRIRAIKTRYGRCVAFYDWWEQDAERSEQFLQQAAHLDRVVWRKQRMASRAATNCQLKRFRFRHKRQAVLTSLEARWEAAAPTSVLP